jgi:hypothetical protein
MTISKDVFLALLSLDSYNRGYNASLDLGDHLAIGKATAGETAEDLLVDGAAIVADFQAVVYDVSGVEGFDEDTAISYRGTDGRYDVWSGWTLGAGYTGGGPT